MHSDSGFTKEQEKGYGIRGANFLRAGHPRGQKNKKVWHLLDVACNISQARHAQHLQV